MVVVTCTECGYRWEYRGRSWRTQCRACRAKVYVPVATRPASAPRRSQWPSRAPLLRRVPAPHTQSPPAWGDLDVEFDDLDDVERDDVGATRSLSPLEALAALGEALTAGRGVLSGALAPSAPMAGSPVAYGSPLRPVPVLLACGHMAALSSGLGTGFCDHCGRTAFVVTGGS